MPRKPTAGYIVLRNGRPLNAFWTTSVLLLGSFDRAAHVFATRREAERAVNESFKDCERYGGKWEKCEIVRLVREANRP